MAGKWQLGLLKHDVAAWNRSRQEHPEVKINFSGSVLRDANLKLADLRGASLTLTDLRGANLSGADLSGADLLTTDLREADLSRANLSGAALSGADLRGADLNGANLSGAHLNQAIAHRTLFVNLDMRGAIGLEDLRHSGPSEISVSTLSLSGGQIPEAFLRGCGLNDWEIEMAKLYGTDFTPHQITEIFNNIFEFRTDPLIQFYSCFISYSSMDEEFAQKLYKDLQGRGVRCWFAPENLKIGDKFRDRIEESIRLNDKLLLILSENSITSEWVEDEVEAAFERERVENRSVLFPIQIDEAVTKSGTGWAAAIRRKRHIGDFRRRDNQGAYRDGLARLLRDLKMEA